MKRILCFGDSNTWGTIPDGSFAHSNISTAYPQLLQKYLGKKYHVISEGMPSRTTDIDDIKYPKGNRNGALFFPTCVVSHDPIDYIVLMLGTNDLKTKFNRNAHEIAKTIQEKYINFVKNELKSELSRVPKFVVVAPAVVDEQKSHDGMFDGATEKSKQFNQLYFEVAQNTNSLFLPNTNLECGQDGIHLAPKSHVFLAKALAKIIKFDKTNKKDV